MKRIALVEIMPHHSEILYSQLLFLRESGFEVSLFCNEGIKSAVESFRGNSKAYYYKSSGISEIFRMSRDVRRSKNGFDNIILNTAQGSKVLQFLLYLPLGLNVVGTIHDTNKLMRTKQKFSKFITQKLISSRINGYYVLAKYIDNKFTHTPTKYRHTWFEPSFFCDYRKLDLSTIEGNDIWVTIPGNISYARRDYNYVINLALNPELHSNVKFILLGNGTKNSGPKVIEKS